MIIAVVCGGASGAGAQPAIEAYERARPETAWTTMQRLRSVFGRHGVTVAPLEVGRMLRDVGKPGASDPRLTYADFVERSDRAFQAFMHGTPEGLPARRSQFEGLIAEAYANPAVIAVQGGSGELMSRTYAALGLCLLRMNNKAGAFAVFAEQLRSYPDLPFTRDKFGSELTDHYNDVRAAESKRQLGTLVVEVNEPSAQIYINESNRGRSGRFQGNVFAGAYRVMVRVGAASARYEIAVESGKGAKLELDWKLERALTASSEWIGLTLTSEDPDAEELAGVRALGRKLGDVASLVVFNVADAETGTQASAALYASEPGRPAALVRRGRVEIRGDQGDDARLEALAQFVMKGAPSPDVADTAHVRRGAVLAPRPDVMPPQPPRVAQPKGRRLPMILVGAGAAAVIAGGVLYALDEDASPEPTMEPEYSDRAPWGVALGAAGVVSIGAGAYLWWRGARSTPTLAVGPSSAIVGWAGAF